MQLSDNETKKKFEQYVKPDGRNRHRVVEYQTILQYTEAETGQPAPKRSRKESRKLSEWPWSQFKEWRDKGGDTMEPETLETNVEQRFAPKFKLKDQYVGMHVAQSPVYGRVHVLNWATTAKKSHLNVQMLSIMQDAGNIVYNGQAMTGTSGSHNLCVVDTVTSEAIN